MYLVSMKMIVLTATFLLQSLYACTQSVNAGNPLKSRLDTLVEQAVADFMSDNARAGLSIGICKDAKTYTYNYGTVDKGKQQLPTAHTVYEIGSISKTFTGLLFARALNDRKVQMEDDVRKYLDGSYPNLEYEGQPIKIIHLLNHTSRLPRFLPDREDLFRRRMDSIPYLLADAHKGYTKERFMQDLHNVKLDTVPGFNYGYSNSAPQLLGFILEKVYNKSFDELVAGYIAGPLEMQQTWSVKPDVRELAKGYDGKGNAMPYSPVLSKPAGGIYSSVSDMLSYMKFQLNEHDTLVGISHMPTALYGDGAGIAFYWRIDQTEDGLRQLWHTGGTFGFSSYCVLYPGINTGIVLLSNEFDMSSQGGLVEIAGRIFDAISKE